MGDGVECFCYFARLDGGFYFRENRLIFYGLEVFEETFVKLDLQLTLSNTSNTDSRLTREVCSPSAIAFEKEISST